ncbi:hypothetical protein HY972_00260 [Candidatus Kaiserbacteria bacterium]|nr:hypothetical protein [Candidatus Kaiserbacteria bacterium]
MKVRDLFKDEVNVFIARQLEIALERAVKEGFVLANVHKIDKDLVPIALERQAVPVIEGILKTFIPEISENIRGLNERDIWGTYWIARYDSPNVKISIFQFLWQFK